MLEANDAQKILCSSLTSECSNQKQFDKMMEKATEYGERPNAIR